ncbi:PREDICTED: ankyrin repeat-containing protein NPR4-like isoform X1 [Nelumbo nucifera]|uniref:Ankyrin repeat-containing protein NPR4-like isoform X1 n=2 Tax=Nelumbo nucifera TaxID=4432 RepID=A0A1U7Z4E5_NELNU|nr:PREDICTED: ankyrin repeat-containing protein NPR4-like isoform X1 [Nelumbo nucifera]
MAFGHNGSTQLAVKIKGVDSTGNGDQVRIIHRGAKYNHLNDIDYFGNNMLHLAAELSPYKQLSRVSGAALQMQRELQWFKEVEKFIPPKHRESRNNNGKTPQALFTEEHKDLVKEGEKWMKDTAQSCMLVATLIATFTFAAAFILPGGNNNDTGIPIFLHTTAFLVFIISDALSLFSSSTSVLIVSGILTSRYAEQDFLVSLHRRLIIGLATLFFSVATMMVAFGATLFLVLHHRAQWVAIQITLLGSVPVCLLYRSFPYWLTW